jgi:hypothetical protein
MSTNVEETVQTETAKPAIGQDAFAAARESLRAQSQDKGTDDTATPSDDTSTETPTQQAETVADESPETTNETEHVLSKEEIAALPPKQRANAEKWQAKLTQESQRLSAERKELEQWRAQAEAEKAKPVQDTTATIANQFSKAVQALPEELRPLFQPFAEAILGEIQPIAQAQQELISKAVASETQGEVKAFESKHPDYRKHEAGMLDWMQKFQPMPGVSTADYMEEAYKSVTANQKKVEQVKETVKQINRSAGSVEPNTPGVPEGRVEQTMPSNWNDMTDKERMRASWAAASKGIVWKK